MRIVVDEKQVKRIQMALLRWYGRHRRDLPWRRTGDPYAIWISEIMLQQTQVATVIPYFERFLKRFPTVRALAAAPLDEVIKLWEGLGYYSRARFLHQAAGRIVGQFNGKIPQEPQELLKLPGIGRYTAGAIASIAYGLDEPVLDGNVQRVLCRVFRVRRNPKETRTQQALWRIARTLIPAGRASEFNQALMDLGATICVPRNPRCPVCPLRTLCQARQHDEQGEIPVKVRRRPLPHFDIAAGVIWKGRKILIDQRKPEGLLGGLWEFPGGKREPGESLEACLRREVYEELRIRITVRHPLIAVDHTFSHFKITLHTFACEYRSGRPKAVGCADFRWVMLDDLDTYPFPKANRRVIAYLKKHYGT